MPSVPCKLWMTPPKGAAGLACFLPRDDDRRMTCASHRTPMGADGDLAATRPAWHRAILAFSELQVP